MQIIKFDIIERYGKDHYFYEIKESKNRDSLFFLFDLEDRKFCYFFSDLLKKWVKIEQNRGFYKKYIAFIKTFKKPSKTLIHWKISIK